MRIVVTGALGFVGQNLARHFRRRFPGAEILGVDLLADPLPREARLYDRLLTGCFAESGAAPLYSRADVIVHLAAQASVPASLADPAATFDTNVARTQVLLDRLRRSAPGAYLVFASSIAALGEAGGRRSEPAPVTPYGASKLAAEGLLSAYRSAYGLASVALRFANVYGPASGRNGGLIPTLCRAGLAGGPLWINGDGGQSRDFIHAADIAEAVALAIDRRVPGTYQLGTGKATKVASVAARIAGLLPGGPVEIRHREALHGERRHSRCPSLPALRDMGFQPRIGLAEGLRSTLNWFAAASAEEARADASFGSTEARRWRHAIGAS